MNVIFISPQFPETYWQFCAGLKRNGATVLGIGDTPYDGIPQPLKETLDEYYYAPSLEDYDAVFRAVAFFSYKYGKIDWIESNNEYWLGQDARLRDDFNVRTGASAAQMAVWQSKAGMKPLYKKAGVPTARQVKLTSLRAARAFATKCGYPLFAKPEVGMGSAGAFKIEDDAALERAVAECTDVPYVLEEFVEGELCSYDAIIDSHGEPLFENQEEFPPGIADVVAEELDMSYYARPSVDPKLQAAGRAVVKGFGVTSRFVHLEFFRLVADKPGLGQAGDYVGLEANLRAPGGFTPELLNYAHAVNVYQIWADMVCFDRTDVRPGAEEQYCNYACRRRIYTYKHSHEDVYAAFGDKIVAYVEMPDALADDLGNTAYVARFATADEMEAFVEYVHDKYEDVRSVEAQLV